MTNTTRIVATYAANVQLDSIPTDVRRQAKVVLADTVAILIKASTRSSVRTALRAMPAAGNGKCTIIGHGGGAAADHAAFINGIGGHDIELDDSHSPSRTHAASVLVPASIAAAEISDRGTGTDLLAGLVAAYDVQCRISKAMGVQAQFDNGFHPTVVCGSIGAAVCAARILGLSDEQMENAIGLATSQSSGLMTFEDDFSHMLKSFHTGLAARNGLTAAMLAAEGYRSAPDSLAGRHNVVAAFGGETIDISQLTRKLGEDFEISGTSIKRHACCGQTHSSIDAMLSLLAEHQIKVEDIEAIEVKLAHNAVPIIDGNPLWTHNIQYVLALAAYEGLVGVHHFSSDWTSRPDITALSNKVTVSGDDRLQSRFPSQKGAIVTVKANGSSVSAEVDSPVGNPANPLSSEDLESKFNALVTSVFSREDSASLWRQLWEIDEAADISGLSELLQKSPEL